MLQRYISVLACVCLLNVIACGDDDAGGSPADAGIAGKGGAGAGRGGSGARTVVGGSSGASAGKGGSSGASAGKGGSPAAGSGDDAGADDAGTDKMLGSTGLRVSDILGFYSGDWGDMLLRVHGDEIWGAYQHDEGTVVGKINAEGVFVGWWSEVPSRAPSGDAGDVEFRWSRDSAKVVALDGRWRYGTTEAWHDDWDVELVTDRGPPADIDARFAMPDAFKRKP